MEVSNLDRLSELDQYARLDFAQQYLSEIKAPHVEYMLGMVQALLENDDVKTASDVSEIAILCAIALNDHMILAKALTIRARILFATGDYQSAIHYTLQALNWLRWEYPHLREMRDFFLKHSLDFGIALIDQRIASSLEPIAAIDTLKQVEAIYKKYDYEIGIGYVNLIKGGFYKDLYRLEDALTSNRRALQILRRYEMHTAELLVDLSYVCGLLDQLDVAELYLEEAQTIYQDEGNELGLAGIYVSKTAFLRRKRQYRELIRLYRQAYVICQQYNEIEDAAFVEMNIGTLLLHYPGHEEQSIIFLKSAIASFDQIGNKRLSAKSQGYLAAMYYIKEEYMQARELLIPIVDGANTDVPLDTLWQSFYYMGGLERIDGNFGKAYEYYQKAVKIIDDVRVHLRTEELMIDFLNQKPDYYRPLVSLANRLRKPLEALDWIEQSKSRAFLQILGNTKLAHQSEMDASLSEQLTEIDAQITILNKTLDSRKTVESPEVLSNWTQSLNEKITKREQLRREQKVQNAEMASLVNVQPINWDELETILSN